MRLSGRVRSRALLAGLAHRRRLGLRTAAPECAAAGSATSALVAAAEEPLAAALALSGRDQALRYRGCPARRVAACVGQPQVRAFHRPALGARHDVVDGRRAWVRSGERLVDGLVAEPAVRLLGDNDPSHLAPLVAEHLVAGCTPSPASAALGARGRAVALADGARRVRPIADRARPVRPGRSLLPFGLPAGRSGPSTRMAPCLPFGQGALAAPHHRAAVGAR